MNLKNHAKEASKWQKYITANITAAFKHKTIESHLKF